MEQQDVPDSVEQYDVVILGSGEGGKYLAWTLGHDGRKVAVVEQRYIGGSCPNIACLPSKNIIHSAKVASLVRRGAEFGVMVNGFTIDAHAVIERKRKMVADLVDLHLHNFAFSGAELVLGRGRFVAPKTIQVALNDGGVRTLCGEQVVIGSGTHASLSDVPGMAAVGPWTHVEALEAETIPETLIILGGGYVGLEFAQAAVRFGSRVIVIEHNTRLIAHEDEDVSDAVQALLEDEGVRFMLETAVQSAAGRNGSEVKLEVRQGSEVSTVIGTHILLAAGRVPNTAALNLEATGVELTQRGYIQVNEMLQTTAAGIWALGEIAGSPQFTHISFDDFRVIRDNMSGKGRVTTGRLVPYTLFTDPELARVGLNEQQARASGKGYKVFQVPMSSVLRTRTLSETRGFLKAIVGEDERICGFTAFGTGAGEIMGAVQMAMIGHLPYTSVRDAVITHPTLIEGLVALFSSRPRSM